MVYGLWFMESFGFPVVLVLVRLISIKTAPSVSFYSTIRKFPHECSRWSTIHVSPLHHHTTSDNEKRSGTLDPNAATV